MGRGAAAAPSRHAPAPRGRNDAPHQGRSHAAPGRNHPGRRRSGHARTGGARALPTPLPVRLWNAPFARTTRARTSRVLDALLSGRGWIALVFLLLAGIVFFNVDLLQMNRDIAANSEKIAKLKRENARLLLDRSRLSASERIQEEAAKLGLVLPAPGEVRYLKARPARDARRAAKRITVPDDPTAATDTGGTASDPGTGAAGGASIDPVTGFPVDPATGQPVYDPVTGAPLDPATGQPLDLSAGAGASAGADPVTGAPAPDPAATGAAATGAGGTGSTGTTTAAPAGTTTTAPAGAIDPAAQPAG
jgi:cell division protein FtsL